MKEEPIAGNGRIVTFMQGVIRSYSQIFFSESYWFAVPLILVSFFDISAGATGLISVLTANLTAVLLKFDRHTANKGYFGFNSLLLGLGLGYYYNLTLIIIVVAMLAGFLTLLITIALQGILGRLYLPALSLPFVFSIWIVLSAGGMLSGTTDNQTGVYVLNRLFSVGGYPLVRLHQWWVSNITSDFLNGYFLSLGAIFFQFNVFAGIVISVSLLFYSRIAFLLSLIGYAVAYLAYSFFGMDMNQLGYSYIGFNFILGAIAIGGYFYIPSLQSFFWVFAITPVIALVAAGLSGLLKPFNLLLISLPFNLTLITFIYTLRFRTGQGKFREVAIQEGTPERNLYSYQSFAKRFPNFGMKPVKLPFYGEWFVSQGHNGEITHRGDWSYAWDFVIVDREHSEHKNGGNNLNDYFCFGQVVLSPAEGIVVVAEDGIDDNNIGEVNTLKNWGNTVIIKHADGFFSKLCHLRKGSVSVKVGETVHQGQAVAKVGNSGRSPYPHLHFQLQANPYIGSKTLKYPIFSYLENGKNIHTFSFPLEGQTIKPVEENVNLRRAFNLMPGTKMHWSIKTGEEAETVVWEVFTNIYNRSYIFCNKTKSVAYFHFDGVYFYFTHFDGDRKSLLYYFYLAAFRVSLVEVNGNITTDSLPLNQTFNGIRLFIHDFTAPFFNWLKADSAVTLKRYGPEFDIDRFEYNSEVTGYSFSRPVWNKMYKLTVYKDNSLKFEDIALKLEAVCESY